MDTLRIYPNEITTKLSGEIASILQVDFTGDEIKDFLITMKSEDKHNNEYLEYWLTSDFLTFKKKKKYNEGIQYFHFVNLDDDPEPEVYSAVGYEDGIDYALYDLDIKTGNEELVFYFNPVIVDDEQEYWGYPWDTNNIKALLQKTGEIKICVSIDHDIIRYGNITIPENQTIFPVIFFTGQTTQPQSKQEGVRNRKWMTLEEIRKTVYSIK